MYYVNLYDRNYQEVPPTQLALKPLRISAHAIGGYEYAEIQVSGQALELWEALRWLRYYVIIRNEKLNIVWCGFITEATINLGGISIGKSIDTLANRIAVAYTYNDANGSAVRNTTPWGDDTESQNRYGVIEHLESQGDMEANEALALRNRALELYARPATIVTPSGGFGSPIGGTLQCRGLWHHLAWKIFNQPGGVARYEETGAYDHLLGWGFTSNTLGLSEWEDRLHDLNGRLEALKEDDYVVISGAANGGNNGTFRVATRTTIEDPTTYVSGSISFNPTDDIMDSSAGMGFVESYELIRVSGSSVPGNNRYYFTKDSVGVDHITVNPPTVVTAGAGPIVTIEQGHSMVLDAPLTTEYPANSITVTALGTILAQSFQLDVNMPFRLAEVYIRVKRVGNPADSIRVTIRTDSGGNPSSNIESVTLLGSTLGDAMIWVKFSFSNTNSLNYGQTYWLAVDRTGANDPDNYYIVELNEDAGYGLGQVKLWNGSSWVARPVAADMPFQIWSWRETTAQIGDILAHASQHFSDVDFITSNSGIYKRQYRDEDQPGLTEIENLLKVGTSANKRLLAKVTPERVVQIYAEPNANTDNDIMLNVDGTLTDVSGQPLDGRLPVGRWLQIVGVTTNVDEMEKLSPQFVERAEWDCEKEQLSALEFKGAPNPWEASR